MQQDSRFLIFDNPEEFKIWLNGLVVTRPINLIQNHHTFAPGYKEWAKLPDPFHWLHSMEDFQVSVEKFNQIAQNLTTFPDGKIAVCRPFDIAPAGILGANSRGLCIENFGDFDHDDMNSVQKDTIVKLNAFLAHKFNIKIDEFGIVYHHWYDLNTGKRLNGAGVTKTCPGVKFFGGNTVESCKLNFLPLVKAVIL